MVDFLSGQTVRLKPVSVPEKQKRVCKDNYLVIWKRRVFTPAE